MSSPTNVHTEGIMAKAPTKGSILRIQILRRDEWIRKKHECRKEKGGKERGNKLQQQQHRQWASTKDWRCRQREISHVSGDVRNRWRVPTTDILAATYPQNPYSESVSNAKSFAGNGCRYSAATIPEHSCSSTNAKSLAGNGCRYSAATIPCSSKLQVIGRERLPVFGSYTS
jgi:hypothetical protein